MKTTSRKVLLLLAAGFAVWSIFFVIALRLDNRAHFASAGSSNALPARAVFTTAQGKDISIPVEVAATPESRAQGLADRDTLPQTQGMLFVWEGADSVYPFTMAGMRFGLDIIFIESTGEANGKVLFIADRLPACPSRRQCTLAYAPKAYRYVVEVNPGFAHQNSIRAGDTVRILR